ncbi:DUF6252 family protein [Ulvibacter litoralis]|uniref:Uncharacterized protein n=1 Tax=Ulvibacter litoralis TaxID=227084 RepID=A0A1G7CQC9_9FLAO|nr:DUF6252 family protein [Ulvibacter litoralis]GHC46503.1 hypothetical protein GCM10008083_06940 [Ulvibacter litoralis]SDE41509.1 hypothetical protein SAMN05421855_101502 [Ulvibacter litoralis]
MKHLLLFFLFAIVFSSCENTETNDPALQAQLDGSFFKAIDARVSENEDGTYLIQGVTQRETLTIKVSSIGVRSYGLGGSSANYASFERASGDTYFTNPYGSGTVVISNYDETAGNISGTFDFTAVIEGVDTLVAQRGIFFEAPVKRYEEPVIDPEDPAANAGTFLAHIDDNPFNPVTVTAIETVDSIVITGGTTNRSILIKLPLDIETGSVVLPEEGITISYRDGTGSEDALSGNLIVFSHDTARNRIKGTFYIQTANSTITLGQFNVIYQ